jgi:hypothetical protein
MTHASNFDALKTATFPVQEPAFHATRSHENGRLVIRCNVDWKDGSLDFVCKDVCPESEDNFFYFEDEDALVQELEQVLKRRRNQSRPADKT